MDHSGSAITCENMLGHVACENTTSAGGESVKVNQLWTAGMYFRYTIAEASEGGRDSGGIQEVPNGKCSTLRTRQLR